MRTASLAALLAALGCALAGGPTPIRPHLVAAVPEDVPADAPRLLVEPFSDARGAERRAEQRPALALRAHGVFRRGTSQTGDASFSIPVSEGVRADTIATLAHSGLFAFVEPAERSEPEADYRLDGSIEEFAGRRYESTELNLLRAGWLRRERGGAEGVVRVRYRLSQAGRVVWQERIETRLRPPGGGIERAVLDAMAMNSERLVEVLHGWLRPDAHADCRELPVEVLDACGLGRVRASRLLADANLVLEREVSLHLAARVRAWVAPAGLADEHELLEAVQRVDADPGGLVLALAPIPRASSASLAAPRYGLAEPFGRHVLVHCGADAPPRPLSVVHEVAHLFGAVHVSDRSSIMHPSAEFDARMFDPLNRRILRAAAPRPLDQPLPPELILRLGAIYREAALSTDGADPDELFAVLAALETAP